MKFGQYLVENLTPEWKRAYIDYRACKKAIKAVGKRLGQVKDDTREGEDADGNQSSSGADDDYGPSAPPRKSPKSRSMTDGATPKLGGFSPRAAEGRSPHYGSTGHSPRPPQSSTNIPPPLDIGLPRVTDEEFTQEPSSFPGLGTSLSRTKSLAQTSRKGVAFSPKVEAVPPGQSSTDEAEGEGSKQSSEDGLLASGSGQPLNRPSPSKPGRSSSVSRPPRGILSPRLSGSPWLSGTPKTAQTPQTNKTPQSPKSAAPSRSLRSMTLPSPILPVRSPGRSQHVADTYEDLYDRCQPDEQAFFDLLERELDKVEKFYIAREQEAQRRAHDLREQLRELAEHRRIYHELYPEGIPEWEAKVGRILPNGTQAVAPTLAKLKNKLGLSADEDSSAKDRGGGLKPPQANGSATGQRSISRSQSPVMNEHERLSLREAMAADKDHQTYSPERYQKYKKELKTAVMEFYRSLELIKNYRIMNLTGFRKALKKFEKTTKIHCMELYTDERISKCTFSRSESIDGLIKQVEELYTLHFEHGDSKKARDKLRRQTHEKTHYESVFRSGIMLGIALPAAIAALAESSRAETRAAIPAWGGLLQVYGGLFLPVIFAMLFELNLAAYVAARINYEFVMELTRPTLDYRSFFEIPAFLFLTLSYCFYFSFARIGSENVDPTTWPAVWLVFVAVFFLNPLPVLRRQSRYWLLRVLFRVCTPGYSRVEFIAFFLADELNSLIYSLQNIYFFSCAYGKHWPANVFDVCRSGKNWPSALLLCLPALSRFIQCLKRYYDSKLIIHLINAGKYLSVITQQCLFVYWRSRGSKSNDASFIVWVIIATASAAYTCAWDLAIDWSLFRPKSGLLRKDLGYSRRFVYYFAMVSNLFLRFIFIWYIPNSQSHVRTRSFFFAFAEMLRRWQWNFFRVETEHLGNADAYRVTREIPLPYRRVNRDSDDDDDEASPEREKITRASSRRSARKSTNLVSVQLDKLRRRITSRSSKSNANSISNSNSDSGQNMGSHVVINGLGGRGPDALDAGPRGHRGQREYEARRPGDSRDDSISGEERV
ncbi:hypothetical protein CI109_104108 [Kwoniella shandongensis]|uniref:Uncharacterized protein n=1 Tax=Kwoniella shandongensis TaxID=1734106 RepID=A0A5M6C2G9_9TREE|nr:uncharacterized protein CI109_002981 [Kwoniella shandongensis]KAA5528820.1 hypothetical protein CI109_002981 [Kwoniella shandongensis]